MSEKHLMCVKSIIKQNIQFFCLIMGYAIIAILGGKDLYLNLLSL